MDDNYVKKNPKKVGIKLLNRDYCPAFVHLEKNQRLQDLINDHRPFIPVYFMTEVKDTINYRCVMINKKSIESIQEWRQDDIPLIDENIKSKKILD